MRLDGFEGKLFNEDRKCMVHVDGKCNGVWMLLREEELLGCVNQDGLKVSSLAMFIGMYEMLDVVSNSGCMEVLACIEK